MKRTLTSAASKLRVVHPPSPCSPLHRNHTTSSSNSTVSPTEVSHFNALASSWWDPHGPSRLLHLMNPLRQDFIRACLTSQSTAPPSTPRSLRFLDVGCGGGIFAESAARLPLAKSVTAVDPSPEVLAVARAHARRDPALQGRLRYVGTSIEQLSATLAAEGGADEELAEGYDVVTLFEVLEHVDNRDAFLGALAAHVRPGGWLVLSTIARTWTSWVVTKLVAEDLLRIVPRGTHDWNKYVDEPEVRAWFADGQQRGRWDSPRAMGVAYLPGLGWREVPRGEDFGNYFFAIRKKMDAEVASVS